MNPIEAKIEEVKKFKILELYSGTGEFSRIARELGHETFTIDNNPKCNPDLCCDILDLDINKIPFKPDFIWASPPCIDYSHAKRTGTSFIEHSNMMVIKVLNLISIFNPKIWIIENPQTGTLKFQYFMKDLPYTDVSYCMYGKEFRKQTRLWNNFRFTGKVCNHIRKHQDSCGNGRVEYTSRALDSYEKGSIPIDLSKEIIRQAELKALQFADDVLKKKLKKMKKDVLDDGQDYTPEEVGELLDDLIGGVK